MTKREEFQRLLRIVVNNNDLEPENHIEAGEKLLKMYDEATAACSLEQLDDATLYELSTAVVDEIGRRR